MYCQKCGKELDDEAVVCIQCGCATKNQISQSVKPWDTDVRVLPILVVVSFLFPICGIVWGIVYNLSHNETRKRAGNTYLKAALISMLIGVCAAFIVPFILTSIN